MAKDPMKRTTYWLAALAVAMFGFGFALVPLYDVMCKALGVNRAAIEKTGYVATSTTVDTGRSVKVQFVTSNDGTMPWEFHPHQFEIKVNPGAENATSFFVRNTAPKQMTAQAIPTINPPQAAPYFHKTECFCFRQQTLASGAALDMPVRFIVDQALPPSIHTITLSYSLFDVTGKVAENRVATVN